jgi:hypothetical protein
MKSTNMPTDAAWRESRLAELARDGAAVIDELLDAPTEARPALIAKHAAIVAEGEALLAELDALKARRASIALAQAERDLEAATAQANAANADWRRAHTAHGDALTALQRWHNGGFKRGDSDAAVQKRAELETARVQAHAALTVAVGAIERAKAEKGAAQAALDALAE